VALALPCILPTTTPANSSRPSTPRTIKKTGFELLMTWAITREHYISQQERSLQGCARHKYGAGFVLRLFFKIHEIHELSRTTVRQREEEINDEPALSLTAPLGLRCKQSRNRANQGIESHEGTTEMVRQTVVPLRTLNLRERNVRLSFSLSSGRSAEYLGREPSLTVRQFRKLSPSMISRLTDLRPR